MFGGSGQLDNLVSQASDVNLSQLKKLENAWKGVLENGGSVDLNIRVLYAGTGERPVGFEIDQIVNGVSKPTITIAN